MNAMKESWAAAGHADEGLRSTAFALGYVLEDGEAADSPRAVAQAGPRAAVLASRCGRRYRRPTKLKRDPDSVANTVAEYVEYAKQNMPTDAPYLENHNGHLMFVRDGERPYIANNIESTTFTGTHAALAELL